MNNEQEINHVRNEIAQLKAIKIVRRMEIERLEDEEQEIYELQVKLEDILGELYDKQFKEEFMKGL